MHVYSGRGLRALQHFADFAAGESLLRLQQYRSPLLRRKLVERGPKPADRLLQHRLALGAGFTRRRIESVFVGIVAARSFERREPPPPSVAPLMVDAQVDQDPVEPGREARAPVEAAGRFVEPDKGVLRDVARVGFVAENGRREPVGASLMAVDHELKCVRIAGGDSLAKFFIRRLHRVSEAPRSFKKGQPRTDATTSRRV